MNQRAVSGGIILAQTKDGPLKVRAYSVPNRYFAVTPWLGYEDGTKAARQTELFAVTHTPTGRAVRQAIIGIDDALWIAEQFSQVPFPWHLKTARGNANAFRRMPRDVRRRLSDLQHLPIRDLKRKVHTQNPHRPAARAEEALAAAARSDGSVKRAGLVTPPRKRVKR